MLSALQLLRPKLTSASQWCGKHLNFFRVHVLVFTFTPLIAACIFYACNGENHIKFIDCLFCCVSAMTVTGLVTINISITNGGQQAILFILMCFGNISAVSITMIWIRRSFFRKKFEHVVRRSAKIRKRMDDVEEQERRERRHHIAKIQRIVGLKSSDSATTISDTGPGDHERSDSSSSEHIEMKKFDKKKQQQSKTKRKPLRADMIRRIDGPAFLINSAGDPSNTIPEMHVLNTEAAPLTQEPESIDQAGQNQVPSTGGILASPTSPESDNALGASQQQPSIRISLPNTMEAYSNSASRRSSGPRRLSIPRFDSRHDPDAESDRVNEEAIVDDDQSSLKSTAADAHPASPPLRARFPDGHVHSFIGHGRRLSDPPKSHYRRGSDTGLHNAYKTREEHQDIFPRAQTVEFAVPNGYKFPSEHTPYEHQLEQGYTTGVGSGVGGNVRQRGTTFNKTMTGRSYASGRHIAGKGIPLARTQTSSKQRGFGGFPTPLEIAGFAIKKAIPGVQERFQRSMTMPRTSTFTSVRSGGALTDNGNSKAAPYLSFDATVSRNSRFYALTEAQRDELGGVEYRALDLLSKLVPAYWLVLNLGMVTMVAPYINSRAFNKYKPVFEAQGANQPGYTWFWFFQVVSAYSNTGMSLIDSSMGQMYDAYFLLITMGFLILAGNTGFPIVLRFFIWCFSMLVPSRSRIYETLRFLLDHPRRCFVYLFPSSQTWFLFFILVLFNVTDWIAFLVLDLGNPVIEMIKPNIRVFDGLFQSIAVRSAGFTVVTLLTLAPAVQFLYVVMMYLSAFPLALSVRSTNVYEEKSLGVYVDETLDTRSLPQETNNAKLWGSFLASHARRQLAFDIWWLGFSLWLVCIIERHNIQDPSSDGWFTIFSCMFELTSAYGTVGLSLGTPYDNFSLSGRFHTLSKLVVCAVMVRGRHRGLPVAIDRAILLPSELEQEDLLDDDSYSHIDETWDHDSTFIVDQPEAEDGTTDQMRSQTGNDGAIGLQGNGTSSVRRTISGVSFAVGSGGRRGSSGPTDSHPPFNFSPKQHAETGSEPRRSFTMPPSTHPSTVQVATGSGGGNGGGGGLMLPTHQLSAIDEMPSGSTPLSGSRAESPNPPHTPSTNPPSFKTDPSNAHSDVSSPSVGERHHGTGSAKGKVRDEGALGQAERHIAHDCGCSTPEGHHDPLSGSD